MQEDYNFLSAYQTDRTIMLWTGICRSITFATPLNRNIRATVSFTTQIIYVIALINYAITNFNNLLKIMQPLLLTFTTINVLAKAAAFAVNADIFTELDQLMSNEVLYDRGNENKMFIKKQISSTVWIAKCYRIWTMQALIAYLVTPFVMPLLGYRMESIIFPWNSNKITDYLLANLFQGFCGIIVTTLNTTTDTMFAILCSISATELRVLKKNFQTLDFVSNDSIRKAELIKNLKLYNKVQEITDVIEKMYSYGLLSQFLGGAVVICLTAFVLTSVNTNENLENMLIKNSFNILYFVYLLLQISIYCLYGHDVMTESNNINEAIYLSNWYESDKVFLSNFLILRERLKRPIILTAGKLFPLTAGTLVELLRISYSFFAVLRNMQHF